ncbi:class I SAM-dependent methyltransferase [Dorea sp. YH-dor226]|uniref:class I SAM-dependent methyltransferase n=1 Tax=Dorea sp. YH-dor226 TaxID=3151119 RepID=UPI00324289A8
MKAMASDWYKKIWTLDIQNHSWVEDTKRQVDFLVEKLEMKGDEKILDLACGFGRHSMELARC